MNENTLVLIQQSPWIAWATGQEYVAEISLQPRDAKHAVEAVNVPMAFSPCLHPKFHMPWMIHLTVFFPPFELLFFFFWFIHLCFLLSGI